MIVTALGSLDNTIVSTALPTISRKLNSSSQSEYSWTASIYLLTCTAVIPVTGKLTDIIGMKPMLYSGIALFVLSSGLAGSASSMKHLIAFRALQGMGRGMMRVSVQIILSNIIALQKRGLVNSIVGLTHTVSTAIGPLVGGAIVEHISWSWCFWINLPLSAITFLVVFFFLRVNQPTHSSFKEKFRTFDYLGLFLIVGGSVCILLGFSFASSRTWKSPATISLLVVGWLLLIVFGFWEIKAERIGLSPMVPPRLFKLITPSVILIGNATHSIVYYNASFYLAPYFQYVKLNSPQKAGLHMLAYAFGSALASFGCGLLLFKIRRYRLIIWCSWVMLLIGNALCIDLNVKSSQAKQVIYLLVFSLGNGGLFSTPLTALQACMTLKQTNTSTSSFSFVRDLSGTMAISLGGTIIHTEAVKRLSNVEGGERFIDLAEIGSLKDANIGDELKLSVQRAYAKAISTTFVFTSALAAVGFLSSLLIKKYTLDVKNAKEGEEKETSKSDEEGESKNDISSASSEKNPLPDNCCKSRL